MSWAFDVTVCEQTSTSHPCADSRTPVPFPSNQHWGLCPLSVHKHTERNTAYIYTNGVADLRMRPSGDLPVSARNPEFSQNRFYRLCHMLIIIKGIIHGSDLRQHIAFNSAVRCKITCNCNHYLFNYGEEPFYKLYWDNDIACLQRRI
jgi:hypothetical protein